MNGKGANDAAFGPWLKERRKSLDLTQEELADRLGCSPWTITKIETGERRPSRQLAELLSEQLQIPEQEQAEFIRSARLGQAAKPPGFGRDAPRVQEHRNPPHNNLPAPLTPIIGRDAEANALRCRLREGARLVTLTGPPGIGKTRLALEVARSLLGDFRDGVCFAALAPVRDPGLLPLSIAQALGVRVAHGQTAAAALAQALRDKQLLLVLDNFEQLVQAGPVIADLLRACSCLCALVTSREALHVRGEEQFVVPPLAVPEDLARLPGIEELPNYPAMALFLARARSVKADFTLSEENARTVASICAHLDGLPLAIELIAARIRLLPPWAVLARLGSSLALLTSGPRDVAERHQTLRAAISWSYDLLTKHEQLLLARLSVFPGGCTLEAAEAVCNTPTVPDDDQEMSTLDGVESLINKSLLLEAEQGEGEEPRYRMLQTIREYALERLGEIGDEEATMRRFAGHFARLAEEAKPNLTGPNQTEWLDRLEEEHDNIRAALEWLTSHRDELALKMVTALWYFWEIRGYLTEGREWLDQTLAHTDAAPSPDRARVLHVSSGLVLRQGDYERAKVLSQESLSIARRLSDKEGMGRGLHALGICEETLGNLERAGECYEESLRLWNEVGHTANMGRTLNSLGVLARTKGHYERALQLFRESLQVHMNSGNKRSMALALANMGTIAVARKQWEEARKLFTESLALRYEIGHKVGIGDCLIGLGCVHAGAVEEHDDAYQAARLFAAATTLFGTIDYEMEPSDRKVYEQGVELARARLGTKVFRAAWEEGEAMEVDEAVRGILMRNGKQ